MTCRRRPRLALAKRPRPLTSLRRVALRCLQARYPHRRGSAHRWGDAAWRGGWVRGGRGPRRSGRFPRGFLRFWRVCRFLRNLPADASGEPEISGVAAGGGGGEPVGCGGGGFGGGGADPDDRVCRRGGAARRARDGLLGGRCDSSIWPLPRLLLGSGCRRRTPASLALSASPRCSDRPSGARSTVACRAAAPTDWPGPRLRQPSAGGVAACPGSVSSTSSARLTTFPAAPASRTRR
jgi:hypothetical protein